MRFSIDPVVRDVKNYLFRESRRSGRFLRVAGRGPDPLLRLRPLLED
jgi:hypothetical protein